MLKLIHQVLVWYTPVVVWGDNKPLYGTRNASTKYCASRKSFFQPFSENKNKKPTGLGGPLIS